VSFLANPATGVQIYYKGNLQTAGGTSLGAPAWAAIWTLVKSDAAQSGKTVGAAPSYLYRIGNSSSYSQAFTDITSGSNGAYSAKPGWDAVTGWGTPLVNGLASAVAAISQ
jgi:kumamolisin